MKTPHVARTKTIANPVPSLLAAATVAAMARRFRSLSRGGSLAATAVGGAVVAGTGLRGGAALMTFFVSSTLLGRLPRAPGRRQRRGNERDAVQVLANGGVAAVCALAMTLPRNCARPLALSAFGGALATATADTWATEIGSRASTRPRSIVTGKPVPAGTSGGVSWAGSLAAAVGATSIAAVVSTSASGNPTQGRALWRAIAIGGFCGALVDSVLGASVQEVRFCRVCGEVTELTRHDCGAPTTTVRGIAWFNNDAVNLAATLAGSATSTFLAKRASLRPE
jgi:uncharacterized protein (TIGR00297 family)